jgi:hypothetical protein
MSSTRTKSIEERRQFWQMAIETWKNSGMSISKFCEAEGLSEGRLRRGQVVIRKHACSCSTSN